MEARLQLQPPPLGPWRLDAVLVRRPTENSPDGRIAPGPETGSGPSSAQPILQIDPFTGDWPRRPRAFRVGSGARIASAQDKGPLISPAVLEDILKKESALGRAPQARTRSDLLGLRTARPAQRIMTIAANKPNLSTTCPCATPSARLAVALTHKSGCRSTTAGSQGVTLACSEGQLRLSRSVCAATAANDGFPPRSTGIACDRLGGDQYQPTDTQGGERSISVPSTRKGLSSKCSGGVDGNLRHFRVLGEIH